MELYLAISEHVEDFEANELTEFVDSDLREEIPEELELFLILLAFLLGQGSEMRPYFGLVKTLYGFGCHGKQSCAISIGDLLSCMYRTFIHLNGS